MKPHALRKTLWFTNIGLVLACVGVGAWFFFKVMPAAAAVTSREKSEIPAAYKKVQDEYKSQRRTGLEWMPDAPVSAPEVHKFILIEKFEKTEPEHWVYSGPLPPTKIKAQASEGPVEVKPKGLETLGKITTVVYLPPASTVVLFAFNGGKKSRAFGIGDWVREDSKAPEIYKLISVEEAGDAVYEVRYAVFRGGKKEPEFEGGISYGKGATAPKEWPNYLRPVVSVEKPAAGADTPGVTPEAGKLASVPGTGAGGAGTEPGTGETPETAVAEAGDGATDGESGDGDTPTVIEIARKPVDEITLEDMRPEIRVNPNNRNERALLVDENTFRKFKGKNAKAIASTVKTEIAVDKRTGRTLGMRITGLKEGSAVGALQVKKGDILVSINGQKVESRSRAIAIVEGMNPDNIVTVVIDRRGKLLTYKVDPRDPKTRRQIRYFDDLK